MLSRITFAGAALVAIVAVACDTVPLTAPSGSALTLSAASTFVPTGGTTEVTAFVAKGSGNAVQNGTTVHFATNLGHIEPTDVQTKNGYATATFVAGDSSGVADITATSGSIGGGSSSGDNGDGTTTGSNVVRITVGGAAASVVIVSASPGSVPSSGGTVTILASVLDANGNRLRNIQVNFSSDKGTLSSTVATTDAGGEARVQLTTTQESVVTARAGAAADAATVTVTVDDNIKLELVTVTPTNPLQLKITPAKGSSPVSNVVVDFGDGNSTSLGPITSETLVTHLYAAPGSYPVRATQTNQNGATDSAVLLVIVP